MSVPEFQRNATQYQLIWHEEHLSIRVDRLHTEKAGVYGEILIRTNAPGFHPHIHGPVHFNFISTSARKQLANHLKGTLVEDWADILEQTCYKVVEAHREGTPAIDMASHEMPEALGMRVAPILQEGAPTVIFGEGDSLKSYFATYLAVLTRLGTPAIGLTPEPGNVLFLDYEEDEDTFWERLNLITAGLGVAIPDGIYWRKMVEPLTAEMPAIQQLAWDHAIQFIIVDSAAPATMEPEAAEYTIAYFKALRSLNTTSLTIAHDTKASKGSGLYPFGSAFWRNLARSLFHVKADRNQEDVVISLKHTKANNGRRLAPLGFKFRFTEDDEDIPAAVEIISAQAIDYDDLAKDVPVAKRLLAMLNQPMTIIEAAEMLDVPAETVGKAFRRGKGTLFFNNGHLWAKLHTTQ
jgi:hypothetical protein